VNYLILNNMNKNILLVIIILICTIYILFINKFDKLDNVVLSKYHKRINNKKSSLDHLSSIISNLPKINHKIDLNDYELYKNIKENIIYYIGKKQTQENTPIETNNNSITSTIKKYYESMKNYVNPGMVSVQTNGSKNKDDWTIDESNNINNNKNSLIEKNDIGNEITNFFDINILKWVGCIIVSTGVIYIVAAYGDKVFRTLGFYKVNDYVELDKEDTNLLNSIDPELKNNNDNNTYYVGGYNINLYSE